MYPAAKACSLKGDTTSPSSPKPQEFAARKEERDYEEGYDSRSVGTQIWNLIPVWGA
jgi:hypothetical protein